MVDAAVERDMRPSEVASMVSTGLSLAVSRALSVGSLEVFIEAHDLWLSSVQWKGAVERLNTTEWAITYLLTCNWYRPTPHLRR